ALVPVAAHERFLPILREERPLQPAGEAGAAAAAQLRVLDDVDDRIGVARQRLARGLIAAPRLVDLERVAIRYVPDAAQDGFKRSHGLRFSRSIRFVPPAQDATTSSLRPAFSSSSIAPTDSSESGPYTRPPPARAAAAKSQMPRHSATSTVSLPSGVVSPGSIPSWPQACSSSSSPPRSMQEIDRQIHSRTSPMGACGKNP